ncbi:hypothetical protein [Psychroserpens sp. S379A]
MKNKLIILLILITTSVCAQELSKEEKQEKLFLEAEKYLKRNKLKKALFKYQFVCGTYAPETEFKRKANARIDSLLPIAQKKEMKKWKGKWELKQLKTDMFDFKKIIVKEDSIAFFKNKSDSIAARIEKIKTPEFNHKNFLNTRSVVFANNEVWEFNVEKHKRKDRLFVKLKTDSEGTSYLILDHRHMIIDRKERKKALAEEVRTFYTRIK